MNLVDELMRPSTRELQSLIRRLCTARKYEDALTLTEDICDKRCATRMRVQCSVREYDLEYGVDEAEVEVLDTLKGDYRHLCPNLGGLAIDEHSIVFKSCTCRYGKLDSEPSFL